MPRLIDADEMMEYINSSINAMTKIGVMVDGEYLWGLFNDAIDNAPTVDAEPVNHRHWVTVRNPMLYQTIPYAKVCSGCLTAFPYEMPYCGECGAKMDEVEEDGNKPKSI